MPNTVTLKMRVPRANPPFGFHLNARKSSGLRSYYRSAGPFPMPVDSQFSSASRGMGAFYQGTPVPPAPAPTSWMSSTTTIAGHTFSNSTLAIGGIAAAALLYWHHGKRHRS